MMNAKRSSNLNLTRYAVLVPMVTVLLMVFSFSKAELIKNNRNQLTNLITATIDEHFDLPAKTQTAQPVSKRIKTKSITTQKAITNHVEYVNVNGIDLPIGVPYSYLPKNEGVLADTIKKNSNVNINKNYNTDSLEYIINGVKATKAEYTKLNNVTKALVSYSYTLKDDTTKKVVDNHNKVFVLTSDDKKFKAIGKDGVSISASKFEFVADQASQTTDLTDKVYVVDGKEADGKTMKNLPASNIEKITVKEGPEMIKEYGDKAKNGVIFITTKKSK